MAMPLKREKYPLSQGLFLFENVNDNVQEVGEGCTMPFIVVRLRVGGSGEKYVLKTGEGVSWEVRFRIERISLNSDNFNLAEIQQNKH